MIKKEQNKIIVISGPTASGKSALAIELAKKIDGVIVNADSMQIYGGLPILSAQPSEYDFKIVEHRLYGVFEPHESNSVFRWLELVKNNIDEIFTTHKVPIVVGGTGMYISRFIDGLRYLPDTDKNIRKELNELYEKIGWDEFYNMTKTIDEESVLKLKKNDKHRLIRIFEIFKTSGKKLSYWESLPNEMFYDRKNIFHINLMPPREVNYNLCELRFKTMLEKMNVLEEVKDFIKNNDDVFEKKSSIIHTIGFIEMVDYLNGIIDYETMFSLGVKNTKNYSKRQYTWFKNQFKEVNCLIDEAITKNNLTVVCDEILTKWLNFY